MVSKSYPGNCEQQQLANDLAAFALEEYYDPEITGSMAPHHGYILPLTPGQHATDSPAASQPSQCPPPSTPARGLDHAASSATPPQGLADAPGSARPATTITTTTPSMSALLPVTPGARGSHIVRRDPSTGRLYACIPTIPADQLPPRRQRRQRQRQRQQPQQAAAGASRPASCNHCAQPPRVAAAAAARLCGFHAHHALTGGFLTRYEAAAMREAEAAGLVDGWAVEDMGRLVERLRGRLQYLLLVLGSEEEDREGAAAGGAGGGPAAGGWGAVGEEMGLGKAEGARVRGWRSRGGGLGGLGIRLWGVYQEGTRVKWGAGGL